MRAFVASQPRSSVVPVPQAFAPRTRVRSRTGDRIVESVTRVAAVLDARQISGAPRGKGKSGPSRRGARYGSTWGGARPERRDAGEIPACAAPGSFPL